MLNLTGEPATLAQRSFGVVEPEDAAQVKELLTLASETEAELQALADFVATAHADAALIRGSKGSAEFDLLARALARRGIRALDARSKVFELYPISEHKAKVRR